MRKQLFFGAFLGFFAVQGAFAASMVSICLPAQKEELMTATVFVAKEKGFFKEEGIDANIRIWSQAGTKAQVADMQKHSNVKNKNDMPSGVWGDTGVSYRIVNNSECNMGTVLVDSAIMSGVEVAKIQPLYLYAYGANYDTHLLVAKNSKINSVADLKGKTIRVGQLPTQVAIRNILTEAGLKLSDVKLVFTDFHTIGEQLAKNKIDAAIGYNPTTALLMASGDVRILKKNVMSTNVQSFVPHSTFSVNKKFAEKNADTVAKVERAILKASQYLAKNPQEFVYTYKRNQKELGLVNLWPVSDSLVEKAAALIQGISLYRPSDVITANGQSYTALEGIDQYQALVHKLGFIKNKLDFASWKNSTARNTASY